MTQPILETNRLTLRPFRMADAPAVQHLAGDPLIADATSNIPHPYEDGMAEEWIETHGPGYEAGELATYAIVLRDKEMLIGAVALRIERDVGEAELGYWIGRPFWSKGYATEAAAAVLDLGFATLGVNRINAAHLERNPASGRVMQKAGMRLEGTMPQGNMTWKKQEHLVWYGLVRDDWSRR